MTQVTTGDYRICPMHGVYPQFAPMCPQCTAAIQQAPYIYPPPIEPKLMVVERISSTAILPTKAHKGDLGYDLYLSETKSILPNHTNLFSTGIKVNFPIGWGGLIRDRSSVAMQKQCFVVAGVIDCDYSNEIKVMMYNSSKSVVIFEEGSRIAQLIPVKMIDFDIIEGSVIDRGERKTNGFGSSGS